MATPRTRNRFSGQGDQIKDSGSQKWINIFGDVKILNNISRLQNKIEREIARKAIARGLIPIADLARSKASEKTGLMKKAIKSTVTKMVSGKVYIDPRVFAVKNRNTKGEFKELKIAGPGRKMKYKDIISNLEEAGGKTKVLKPAKYAHLLEFGTKNMAAKPFMRPAMAEGKGRALREIQDEIKKGIAEETRNNQ
jgi:HK97 gp10 family phage protein